ncbi:MAG TPA: replication-associated recombination protein A [Marinagarivorans sp.]
MTDLFTQAAPQPLASRMRPRALEDYVGQSHLLAAGKPLGEALRQGALHSMILWGPPGVGKTTLARLFSELVDGHFQSMSAVLAGVKDIRKAAEDARERFNVRNKKTVLFVDEVHRFNKSQQDAFLPYVEDGTVVFVGATTENPSFEVNNALLSRCRVYVLKALARSDLSLLADNALANRDCGLGGRGLTLSNPARESLIQCADGDGRRLLNLLELASDLVGDGEQIGEQVIESVASHDVRRFDKGGDVFYEQISALHKSVRGSNPDAALYWMARMFDGGCDPLYVARRVVRMASEDIGNADPRGLQLALNAWDVQSRLGSPEGELAIAQAVVYLACAPKSNAVYKAFKAVMADVKAQPSYDVPNHLRNAPTTLMKQLDMGKDYRYAHDEPDAYAAGEHYFPDEVASRHYYHPVARGLEIKIGEKLAHLAQLDCEAIAVPSTEPQSPGEHKVKR